MRYLLFVVLFLVLSNGPLYADLGDFAESVEKEESENRNETDDDDEETLTDEESEEQKGFWDLFFAITGVLWYVHNSSARYLSYPYADSSGLKHYIVRDSPFNSSIEYPQEHKRSSIRLITGGGAFWESGDPGAMGSIRASGKIASLIGPEIGYRVLSDPSGELHFLQTGLNIPVVQTNPFSLDFIIAAAFYFDLLRLNAVAIGAEIRSYPVDPLSITVRAEGILGSNVGFGELGLQLAYHIRRFEISAGYYGLFAAGRAIQGVEFGAGVNF